MNALALRNELLALLPQWLLDQWLPRMTLVELPKGYRLDLGSHPRVLYFPITCVMAMRIRTARGPGDFLRFTGHTFVAGMVNMLKAGDIHFEGLVQGSGHALTLPATLFAAQLPPSFLGAAPQATAMARIAENGVQSAYCANHHGTSQRLAKILLQAADCFGDERPMTLSQHELGDILSTRRETVAQLLADWNAAGLVESHRARQVILDRGRMQDIACRCYPIVQRFYADESLLWKAIQWKRSP